MRSPEKPQVDLSLYFIVDPTILNTTKTGKDSIEALVYRAIKGGVRLIQLREKNCSQQDFVNLILKIQPILKLYRIPLIINDRLDLALQFHAQGVHLGQSDLSVSEARRVLGPNAIIGLSVENDTQALRAQKEAVDYLGVSSVFPTHSKPELIHPWGLDGLKALKNNTHHPLVAVGGINTSNAQKVFEAGADGIALISTLGSATDPLASARELKNIINKIRIRKNHNT